MLRIPRMNRTVTAATHQASQAAHALMPDYQVPRTPPVQPPSPNRNAAPRAAGHTKQPKLTAQGYYLGQIQADPSYQAQLSGLNQQRTTALADYRNAMPETAIDFQRNLQDALDGSAAHGMLFSGQTRQGVANAAAQQTGAVSALRGQRDNTLFGLSQQQAGFLADAADRVQQSGISPFKPEKPRRRPSVPRR